MRISRSAASRNSAIASFDQARAATTSRYRGRRRRARAGSRRPRRRPGIRIERGRPDGPLDVEIFRGRLLRARRDPAEQDRGRDPAPFGIDSLPTGVSGAMGPSGLTTPRAAAMAASVACAATRPRTRASRPAWSCAWRSVLVRPAGFRNARRAAMTRAVPPAMPLRPHRCRRR